MNASLLSKVGFGGGCHWCTEAVFQSLTGVNQVEQGFIKSAPPADAWSEAVIVHFNVNTVDLATLIEVHLCTHSAASQHSMRDKYRSAVYTFSDDQYIKSETFIEKYKVNVDRNIVTSVLKFKSFKLSDQRYHNYYDNNKDKPFCKRYIEPKIKAMRGKFNCIGASG